MTHLASARTPRPSLNALRAFEATARLRSFGGAADELSVTHGAISRHIRALEDTLGVMLLTRNAHSTELTPDGARLAEGLARAFDLIQTSVEQIKPGPLILSCSESIMMYWLLPRLGQFHAQHPDIKVSFNMNHGPIDFARDNVSVAIRLSSIELPRGVKPIDLAPEWVGPICTPEYMRSANLRRPEDFSRMRLLATKTRPQAWQEWCDASGHTGFQQSITEAFDHFYLLIQAAKCGLGVANVPRMLVRDELRSGTLVAPFGFVPGPHRLVLWVAPQMEGRHQTEALVDWLRNELQGAESAA